MKEFKFALLALTLALYSVSAAAADSGSIYNPSPDKDDVILPLPCDGVMVFRRIYTSVENKKVKDHEFNAGTVNSSSPMAQNPNLRYVQGGFKDKEGYYYLMSKYELTQGQYDALVNGKDKCPSQNKTAALPKVKLSYYDAMNIAHQYSLYLLKEKNALSKATSSASNPFVRLPTDEEWEYAARGGSSVTISQFEADLPPLDGGDVTDYAWFSGAKSSNGRLQLIGRKKPNPLGLYDMLGNAQEMIFEPFKAIVTGRLLGQPGAVCVRGGSFKSPQANITNAARTEKPLYINGADMSADDTGVRLVIASPVASSIDEVKTLNADVQSIADGNDVEDNVLKGESSALAKLQEEQKKSQEEFLAQKEELMKQNSALDEEKSSLEEKVNSLQKINSSLMDLNEKLSKSNNEVNEKMNSLKGKIETTNAEREAMSDALLVENLRLGGFLCKLIDNSKKSVDYYENLQRAVKAQCDANANKCSNYESVTRTLNSNRQELAFSTTYYGDIIAGALSTFYISQFDDVKLKAAKKSFGSDTAHELYIDKYREHLKDYLNSKDGAKNIEKWQKDCSNVTPSKNNGK